MIKIFENLENLNFKVFNDGEITTISGFIGNTNFGNATLVKHDDGFNEFKDVMGYDDFIHLIPSGSFIALETIRVFDEFKNKKLGRVLMLEVIKFAKNTNYHTLYLNASPLGNTGLNLDELVKFYESFGFMVIPHTDNWSENKEMILNI